MEEEHKPMWSRTNCFGWRLQTGGTLQCRRLIRGLEGRASELASWLGINSTLLIPSHDASSDARPSNPLIKRRHCNVPPVCNRHPKQFVLLHIGLCSSSIVHRPRI